MIIMLILLIALKIYFQIRQISFEIQLNIIFQAAAVMMIVCFVLYLVFSVIVFDAEAVDEWRKRKEEREKCDYPSDYEECKPDFIGYWFHEYEGAKYVWGGIYIALFVIFFGIVVYSVLNYEPIFNAVKIMAIPTIIYDILLTIDFYRHHLTNRGLISLAYAFTFELICTFIVFGIIALILAIIAFIALLFTGMILIIVLCMVCPAFAVWWLIFKD